MPGREAAVVAGLWLPGGAGVDVARAIRLLEGEARLVLFAGGASGRVLLESLGSESLAAVAVPTGAPTRFGLYLLEDRGSEAPQEQRAWRSLVEPTPEVSGAECRSLLEAVSAELEATEWLCLAGPAPGQAGGFLPAELVRRARAARVRVLLSATGPGLKEALGAGPELVRLSRAEAARTFGPETTPEALFLELRRAGGRTLVLSDGERPVHVFHDRRRLVLHPPAIALANASTAGESLAAGLLVAMEEGWDLEPALAFAVGAASADAARLFPCGADRAGAEGSMRLVRIEG